MTNWIKNYQTNPKKFQEGGQMAPPEAAPAAAGAGAGAPDLEAMLAEYAQSRDPQLAVAICDALVEMMAAQEAPAPAPEPAPMAKKGAKLNRGPVFKK